MIAGVGFHVVQPNLREIFRRILSGCRSNSTGHSAPPVGAIARRVKPGCEADFEAAVRGVTQAASTFDDLGCDAAGDTIV